MFTRDKTWEEVLEVLSSNGRLNRFFKLPLHEKKAMQQLYGAQAYLELGNLFVIASQGGEAALEAEMQGLAEHQLYAILQILIRSMQCWVETEGTHLTQRAPRRWRIAHA